MAELHPVHMGPGCSWRGCGANQPRLRCCFSTSDCRLVEDTAWHPVQRESMEKWGKVESFIYRTFLGSPLKLWASIGHWWIWHFDLSK